MTYEEFKLHLARAGLTVSEFASIFAMNRSSVSNCAKQEKVPALWGALVLLMAEMSEHSLDFRAALSRLDLEPKRSRGVVLKNKRGVRKAQAAAETSQQNGDALKDQ